MILDFPEIELTKNNALIFTTQLPLMIQHKEEFWKTLSNQEKTQANKFINNYLKDRYVISHGLLRHLLAFYIGINPENIEYSFNQFGKPFLNNNTCGMQFNMSHSKDYAAYIMSLDCQVGIDIEWKDKNMNFQDILESVLSPSEIIFFNQLTPEEKFNTFYSTWTKKEAIIKAIGQGLSYPLKAIEIMNSLGDKRTYHTANKDTFHYLDLSLPNDYAGAAALTRKSDNFIQINL
jgi:4'-phosphopantetheinyl transferase